MVVASNTRIAKTHVMTSFDVVRQRWAFRCLDSLIHYWAPRNVEIYVYVQNATDQVMSVEVPENFHLLTFEKKVPSFYEFQTRFADKNLKENYFIFDAIRFAHKTFAIFEHVKAHRGCEKLVWIDADVELHRPIDRAFEKKVTDPAFDIAFLDRSELVNPYTKGRRMYPECGFVVYNLRSKSGKEFIERFAEAYESGRLFEMAEWHDSFVFQEILDELLKSNRQFRPLNIANINRVEISDPSHVFVSCILGEYMDHRKGLRKDLKKSPEFLERA